MPPYVYLIGVIILTVLCSLSYLRGVSEGKELARGKALTVTSIEPGVRYEVLIYTTKRAEYAVMQGDKESEPRLYRLNSLDGRVRMPPDARIVRFEKNQEGHLSFVEYE